MKNSRRVTFVAYNEMCIYRQSAPHGDTYAQGDKKGICVLLSKNYIYNGISDISLIQCYKISEI